MKPQKKEPEAVAQPTDHTYLAVTEMETFRDLNEKLQLKIAALDMAKGEAIALHADAEGRAISIGQELARGRATWSATENDLRREVASLGQRLRVAEEAASRGTAEQQRLAAALEKSESALGVEKGEVQRAASHARAAGRAAEDAHAALASERRSAAQEPQEAVRRAQQAAAQEAHAAAADLRREVGALRSRCEELEEDVETEREWREGAQRERKECESRCAQLQAHAEGAERLAQSREAATGTLQEELEALRLQAEAAHAAQAGEEQARKDGARRRVRNRQAGAYRGKEAERAKVASLEHEVARLRSGAVEELPKLQQALKREKHRSAQLQQQLDRVLKERGPPLKGGGSVPGPFVRAHSPVAVVSASPRGRSDSSHRVVSGGYRAEGSGQPKKVPVCSFYTTLGIKNTELL